MKNKFILFLTLCCVITYSYSQTSNNWVAITDAKTGITFSSPQNTAKFDSLLTTLYAAQIDTTQAVQVHIFQNATFSNSEPIFNEALLQENGDTLRAIAKLMLLVTNSEITEVNEIYTNGIRGLEIGITYNALPTDIPYHTFVRYYLYQDNFISFTWTGKQTNLKSGLITKSDFFNSVKIK